MVNVCDLTPVTQTQTSEEKYSDLMASNRWLSALYSCNTSQSFSRGIQSYALRLTKLKLDQCISTPIYIS